MERRMLVNYDALAESASARISRFRLPAGGATGAESLTRLADFCRVGLCAPACGVPAHEALGTGVAEQVVARVAGADWADLVLCNPGSVLDLLALLRGARQLAAYAENAALRARARSAADQGLWALQRLFHGPQLQRMEWKAHSRLELALGAEALGLQGADPDWPALWGATFVGRAPRLWQWPAQNLTPFLRIVWALGAADVDVQLRVPRVSRSAMEQAAGVLLAVAVRQGALEQAGHLLLARVVLGAEPGPLEAAAAQLLLGAAPGGEVSYASALAALAVLTAACLQNWSEWQLSWRREGWA